MGWNVVVAVGGGEEKEWRLFLVSVFVCIMISSKKFYLNFFVCSRSLNEYFVFFSIFD